MIVSTNFNPHKDIVDAYPAFWLCLNHIGCVRGGRWRYVKSKHVGITNKAQTANSNETQKHFDDERR